MSLGKSDARSLARGLVPLTALLLLLVTQYPELWRVAFINDDYVILDITRSATFAELWRTAPLPFPWYRPWSRELHFWTLQRAYGPQVLPFHVASALLWIAAVLGFGFMSRRLLGTRAALPVAAAVALLAAWGTPVVWACGVQELWFLAWGGLYLVAAAGGLARAPSALFLAPALLSKETAAVLPAIAIAHDLLLSRIPVGLGLRRRKFDAVVTAAWLLVHPLLRQLAHGMPVAPAEPAPPGPFAPLRTLLATFNLDRVPAPENGWGPVLLQAALAIIVIGVAAWWMRRTPEPTSAEAPAARIVGFGLVWFALGCIPLLLPGLMWRSYYGLLAMMGAWIAIGAVLRRRELALWALVLAMAVLRSGQAATPSADWGSEWYQYRASSFLSNSREQLRRLAPAPAPYTRMFFMHVPYHVGFITRSGPALRTWYRDPTIRGDFLSDYRVRTAATPPGDDRFFRFDSTLGWIEIRTADEDIDAARQENPRWIEDHEMLASSLARGRDWPGAAREFARLGLARPDDAGYPFREAIARYASGDTAGARRALEHAASLPSATAEMREALRGFR